MGFVKMVCPNCGANFDMNPDLDFGVCNFCGTRIAVDRQIIEHRGEVIMKGDVAALLDRILIFLEDGQFDEADKYCERVLDNSPHNSKAYLYKLMAEIRCRREAELGQGSIPLDGKDSYQKAIRFADPSTAERLETMNRQTHFNLHVDQLVRQTKTESPHHLYCSIKPLERYDSYAKALSFATEEQKQFLIEQNALSVSSYCKRMTGEKEKLETEYNYVSECLAKEKKKGWRKFCPLYILILLAAMIGVGALLAKIGLNWLVFVPVILALGGVMFFIYKAVNTKDKIAALEKKNTKQQEEIRIYENRIASANRLNRSVKDL